MLGIDVSKEMLSVCQWQDGQVQAHLEVANSVAGIEQLLCRFAGEEQWAVEPTGRYSDLVVRQVRQSGRQVLSCPPRAAKLFLASVHPRAKSDKLDAKGLAQYAASVMLKPFVLKEATMERLSQLLSTRKLLSVSLASFRQQAAALPQTRAALAPVIRACVSQLRALDEQLAEIAQQEPAIQRLQGVPGIGPVSAAMLVVRLQSTLFASYDQFVAYVGLDLQFRDSGTRHGPRHLSHQGDAELRRLLYLCAQASIRSKKSPFAGQYQRELAKGLAKTQALCAVARKLARLAWAMVRTQACYDPNRVYSALKALDKKT